MKVMSRTIAIVRELYRLIQLWRHNRRVMVKLAHQNARYYTNIGVKLEQATAEIRDDLPQELVVLDPFGKYRDLNQELNDAR